MKPAKPKATAADVVAALRRKYPAEAYALVEEVGNSTGFRCRRHADVVLVGLWPSRGLEIVGIEVKVSRGDWIRELQDPGKADPIAKFCDNWIVATGSPGIVKLDELPINWGLLELDTAGRLQCAKVPVLMKPEPVDRGFVAALVRRIVEQATPAARLRRARNEGKEEGYKQGQELATMQAKHNAERIELDAAALREAIRNFEIASGVQFNLWNAGNVGEAVRAVLSGSDKQVAGRLTHCRDSLRHCLELADEALARLKLPVDAARQELVK